ncbi:MAG: hypothetical protein R3279_08365 [Putridiphycobacter sp.]|nr:hypothetical protein [Putridiphycobacter sp.]
MIVATKIIYEALGQEHICYAPKELTEFQITKIIKGIADTSVVTRISYNCRISEKEFYKQNIKLVEKWIEDLKTYENEPV